LGSRFRTLDAILNLKFSIEDDLEEKQGETLMPVGMFRSEEGWVQVDYGTGNIPIPRSKYEENKYKPDFDKLPSEAEYLAAEKKQEDDAKGS
jgi:hypothetical protein